MYAIVSGHDKVGFQKSGLDPTNTRTVRYEL